MSVTVARSLSSKVKSAVLVNFEQDPASALVGIAYGNKFQLPVLHVSKKDVGPESAKELARRKITSVVLIGRSDLLPTKSAIAKRKLTQIRYDGKDEIEVSEKVLKNFPGDPLILIASESERMIEEAARLVASNRPIVWSKDYQSSANVSGMLEERAATGIFYAQAPEFSFPTRIVITRSAVNSLIASSWQSPVLFADESQSEVEKVRELIKAFTNIASITVVDKELSLTPYRNLS
jgi:hypothetical protein